MKNYTKAFFALFILFGACELPKPGPSRIEELAAFPATVIDTDSSVQSAYRAKWMEHIAPYTKENSQDYIVDIWGGGALKLHLWFDGKGALWDAMVDVDNLPYVLHPLVSDYPKFANAAFIDERTAVVYMPSSASFKLAGNLYVLRVSNNTIYRTHGALTGFNTLKRWDGRNISEHYLVDLRKSAADPDKTPVIPRPPDTNNTASFTMTTIDYSEAKQEAHSKAWFARLAAFTVTDHESQVTYNNNKSQVNFAGAKEGSVVYLDKEDNNVEKYLFKKQVLSNHSYPIFLSGDTAVMALYKPVSSIERVNHTNQGRIYTVRISNDGIIYRTEGAGFGDWDSWIGEKAAADRLVPFLAPRSGGGDQNWIGIDPGKQKEYAESFLNLSIPFRSRGSYNAVIPARSGGNLNTDYVLFDYTYVFDGTHPIKEVPKVVYNTGGWNKDLFDMQKDRTRIFYLDGSTAVMSVYNKPYQEFDHAHAGQAYTVRISNDGIVYRTESAGFAKFTEWDQTSAPIDNLVPWLKPKSP